MPKNDLKAPQALMEMMSLSSSHAASKIIGGTCFREASTGCSSFACFTG